MALPLFMPTEQLRDKLGTPNVPLLIDVRIEADIADDPRLVPGARQMPHTDIPAIVEAACGAAGVVILCQKGAKLSQGVAAALRFRGIPAQALAGGTVAWAATCFPVIDVCARPKGPLVSALDSAQALLRVWTLHRFAAPEAEVWIVAADSVQDVANRFDGTATTEDAVHALKLELPEALTQAAEGWMPDDSDLQRGLQAGYARLDAAYRAAWTSDGQERIA
ncbi:MAG: rhodanese-like domain-containing protein [Pseudomonadota bacterium]